jgi:histidyl-tRNA synthetase
MRFQAPRGTEDVLPTDAPRWQRLETIFRDLTRRYGYHELRTPTFEDTELFTRTAGETSDIVTKEMYTFVDKGGRSITLKPEGTAPAMRAVIEHSLCNPGTVARLMYVTPCFRYNRPQKGRLRELHQFGLELIGSSSPAADAEVIELTYRFFEACGLTGLTVMVNSIGRDSCRERYRQAILDHTGGYLSGQSEEFQAQARKNPLRLLDSKDPDVHKALEGLAPITDFLEDECADNFRRLQSLLTDAGVRFEVRPDIVRGLDYYTETVFEIQHAGLGSQSSICGGGRYDNLVKELGGPPTPSVGVGIGVERTLLAVAADGVAFEPDRLDAYVVQATKEAYTVSLALTRELRAAGLAAQTDIDARSFKSQLRQADKSGARFALILGDEELAKGTVQLKVLETGEQSEIPMSEVIDRVRGL